MRLIIQSGEVSKLFNYRRARGKICDTKVTFTLSDHFYAVENVNKKNYNVLTVSFSHKTSAVSQEIINYCLSYFGFDITKEYYAATKVHRDYTDNTLFKTVYYEQLTTRKV